MPNSARRIPSRGTITPSRSNRNKDAVDSAVSSFFAPDSDFSSQRSSASMRRTPGSASAPVPRPPGVPSTARATPQSSRKPPRPHHTVARIPQFGSAEQSPSPRVLVTNPNTPTTPAARSSFTLPYRENSAGMSSAAGKSEASPANAISRSDLPPISTRVKQKMELGASFDRSMEPYTPYSARGLGFSNSRHGSVAFPELDASTQTLQETAHMDAITSPDHVPDVTEVDRSDFLHLHARLDFQKEPDDIMEVRFPNDQTHRWRAEADKAVAQLQKRIDAKLTIARENRRKDPREEGYDPFVEGEKALLTVKGRTITEDEFEVPKPVDEFESHFEDIISPFLVRDISTEEDLEASHVLRRHSSRIMRHSLGDLYQNAADAEKNLLYQKFMRVWARKRTLSSSQSFRLHR